MIRPLGSLFTAVGLVVVLALAGACQPTKDREAQPDILLVLVAGLHADPVGQPSAEASLLEAFADAPRRSFTNAYSQSISPHLSLGSLLTGIYPSALPLCGFADFTSVTLADQPWCAALPEGRATLPEALAAYGWRTAHLHGAYLEQAALQGRFQQDVVLPAIPASFGTSWPDLEAELTTWWGAPDQPRLVVLQLTDMLDAVNVPASAGTPGDLTAAQASLGPLAQGVGEHLAALVRQLDESSDRPLLVVLSAPFALDLAHSLGVPGHVTALMAPALLDEVTLHVPLHLLGSDVQRSATFEQPVELRAVLPTVLARAGVALPAGVEPLDLLSERPEDHGAGQAYAEVGDMLCLRKGPWLLRFRTMIHHGTALSGDLTTFLQHPVQVGHPSMDDLRFYDLFDVSEGRWPPRDATQAHWNDALALREAMIEVRTGPAAPHPQALDPQKLLELRMTASDGYW